MRIPDANVLLHGINEAARQHPAAKAWLGSAMVAGEPVGLAWIAILAFVRLSTRSGVFPRPLSLEAATSVVADWLARPNVVIVEATDRHLDLMRGLLLPLGTAANLVNDAHLAALALEHGAEVVSFDTDFKRFAGLRCQVLS